MPTDIVGLHTALATLDTKVSGLSEEVEHRARVMADEVMPAMLEVRKCCDALEDVVTDQFWTLPKYREMLFLS